MINALYYGDKGGIASLLTLFLAPYSYYFIGKYLVAKQNTESELLIVVFIVLSSLMLPYLRMTIDDIRDSNELINVSRNLLQMQELDGGRDSLNATLVGMVCSSCLAGIGVFLSSKRKGIIPVLFLLLSIVTLFINIHILNRTAIFAFVICLMGEMVYFSKKNKKFILWTFVVLCLVYWLIVDVIFVNQDLFLSYENRFETDESSFGGRLTIWGNAIVHLFEYPFGWRDVDGFCHNMWLDIAREGGILPFICILGVTFNVIKPILRIRKIQQSSLICLFIGVDIIMFAYAFMEPVYQGNKVYFYSCCLIWGMQAQLLRQKDNIQWINDCDTNV